MPDPKATPEFLRRGGRQLLDRAAAARRTDVHRSEGRQLSKIAKAVYGERQQWRKIYEANKDQIKNPDLIHPGQTFRIP